MSVWMNGFTANLVTPFFRFAAEILGFLVGLVVTGVWINGRVASIIVVSLDESACCERKDSV